MSPSIRRELAFTLILIVGVAVLRLLPYSLIATLWNRQTIHSAWAAYRATLDEKLVDALVWSTILVVFTRVWNWFENRPKTPIYGERDDGYKASYRD